MTSGLVTVYFVGSGRRGRPVCRMVSGQEGGLLNWPHRQIMGRWVSRVAKKGEGSKRSISSDRGGDTATPAVQPSLTHWAQIEDSGDIGMRGVGWS